MYARLYTDLHTYEFKGPTKYLTVSRHICNCMMLRISARSNKKPCHFSSSFIIPQAFHSRFFKRYFLIRNPLTPTVPQYNNIDPGTLNNLSLRFCSTHCVNDYNTYVILVCSVVKLHYLI